MGRELAGLSEACPSRGFGGPYPLLEPWDPPDGAQGEADRLKTARSEEIAVGGYVYVSDLKILARGIFGT